MLEREAIVVGPIGGGRFHEINLPSATGWASLSPSRTQDATSLLVVVDPLLALLVGALGAAVLTTAAGFLGAWLQSRREHDRWVREQRLAAYNDFMRVADRVPKAASKAAATYGDELKESLATLTLLGPDSVIAAGTKFMVHAILEADKPRIADREENRDRSVTDIIRNIDMATVDMRGFTIARIEFARAAQAALAIDSEAK